MKKHWFWCLAALLALPPSAMGSSGVRLEQLDRYDPTTGAFLGREQTWFGPDGRRLRQEVRDADGTPSLLFFLLHDNAGREIEGIYFESAPTPYRETFQYSDEGRTRTTIYVTDDGSPPERTVDRLDEQGRTVSKEYYRRDGTQYGEETVLWDDRGRQAGWDFRYLQKDREVSFRYSYDDAEPWTRRVRTRDGSAEFIEARTPWRAGPGEPQIQPVRFADGVVSTDQSETSPSFDADATTMVFARYGDDWRRKTPYIATRGDGGWTVSQLPFGEVYNLAISPDGQTIVLSEVGEGRRLLRSSKVDGSWSAPEPIPGIRGAYPALTDDGRLFYYDSEGPDGGGIHVLTEDGPEPWLVSRAATIFDAFPLEGGDRLLVTRCGDETCDAADGNGIRIVSRDGSEDVLPRLPYAWGSQVVEALGILVFTNGEDILAAPLDLWKLATP